MTVFGYLSADDQLPDDYRSSTTIAYFMRRNDFIRVIENRTTGNIHYRIDNKVYSFCANESMSLKESQSFEIPMKDGMHIYAMRMFLNSLPSGSTVLFSTVKELSADSHAALFLYRQMIQKGVSLEFLEQPWLNSKIFTTVRQEYNGIDLLVQEIMESTYSSFDQGRSYIALLSGRESNKDKKNVRKR